MATLFVRHIVADNAAWRKGYDGFAATRRELGVTSDGVYQLDGNPNDLTVYHEFASMEAAKAFAASPELKEAMAQAGVQGHADIWFTNKA